MIYLYIFWLIFGILAIIFSKGIMFAIMFGVICILASFLGIMSEIKWWIKLKNINSKSRQKEFTKREAENLKNYKK